MVAWGLGTRWLGGDGTWYGDMGTGDMHMMARGQGTWWQEAGGHGNAVAWRHENVVARGHGDVVGQGCGT